MAAYNEKNALIDLGFISGYVHTTSEIIDEWLLMALERIEGIVVGGFSDAALKEESQGQFLFDLGDIWGRLWEKPIADAVSSAIDRVILHYSGTPDATWEKKSPMKPESPHEMLSNQDRGSAAYGCGEDVTAAGLAECGPFVAAQAALEIEVGEVNPLHSTGNEESEPDAADDDPASSTPMEIADVEIGIADVEPLATTEAGSPIKASGKRRREWTPEQRAELAERAKKQRKPPFDDDFASVKADFDAGMTCGKIANKWGCSDAHIRNFLMKQGIDPRKGHDSLAKADATIESTAGPELTADPQPSKHQLRAEYEWAQEDKDALVALREQHADWTWEQIGKQIGKKAANCCSMYYSTKKNAPVAEMPDPVYIGKRSDSTLHEDDWGDIQKMISGGAGRRAIASDYDVTVEELNRFIDGHLQNGRINTHSHPSDAPRIKMNRHPHMDFSQDNLDV